MDHKLTKEQKASILRGLLQQVKNDDKSALEVETRKYQTETMFNIKLILRK